MFVLCNLYIISNNSYNVLKPFISFENNPQSFGCHRSSHLTVKIHPPWHGGFTPQWIGHSDMSCPFLHVCNVWKYMKVSTNHLPLDSHYGMRCVKIVSFPFISSRSGDGSKAIIYFYYYHILGNKHPLASYD